MNKFYIFLGLLLLQTIFVKAQWGESDSRTESRDDAGLQGNAGAKSGFYQTVNPINFPTGAQGWWHLLDVRHSNLANNFAMQFSGNFYDQLLYFRKTGGNPSQPWSQILSANSDGILNNSNINILSGNGQSFFTGHQAGSTYSYPNGIFHAVTENSNGQLNYFFDGVTAGTRKFYARADGQGYFEANLSIGTTNPQALMDVGKLLNSGELATVLGRLSEGNAIGAGTYLGVKGYGTTLATDGRAKSFSLEHSFYGRTNSAINFFRGAYENGGGISFSTDNNTEKMWILDNGNVGIGTAYPVEKLAVNGTVRSKEVIVEADNWPDYVFKPTYRLAPLQEIKAYVDANQHLPDVPSEKEISQNGLSVSAMNKLLMKKVEELTLYLIEKDLKDKAQQEQIDILSKRIDQLCDSSIKMK